MLVDCMLISRIVGLFIVSNKAIPAAHLSTFGFAEAQAKH